MITCSACRASNPDHARWCGQCLTPFADAPGRSAGAATPPTAPAAPHAAPAAPHAGTAAVVPEPPDPGTGAAEAGAAEGGTAERSGIRRRGDEIDWRCVTCETYNPIEVAHCTVCGTSFAARFQEPEAPEPPRDWRAALALTALVPGIGHVLVDRAGTGVARAVLYLVWLAGGLLTVRGGGSPALAVPLLLGAAALWAGSMLDILALQRGQGELLTGRTFMWLVMGVTLLALLGLMLGVMRLG